jgi:putative membrane protein
MVWISLPLILAVWAGLPYGIYGWVLLIPALLLGYQQYRDARILSNEDTVILQSRLLSKTTAIIKKYRAQACRITQNPFQSRLQLSNFTVHVASGNQGRSFTVRELAKQQGLEYLEWIADGSKKESGQYIEEDDDSPILGDSNRVPPE